jgi:predicted RNA-binding protein with PUA-like domain
MAYWLFKSEPESWSWSDQIAKGKAGQEWDGVRNYQARNHMRAMRPGERGFFYHSGGERRIVGIVEIIRAAHPDSTDTSGVWDCVDIRAVAPLAEPVTLEAVKAEPRLAAMALVANSRLSVQPVRDEEWELICAMGGRRP